MAYDLKRHLHPDIYSNRNPRVSKGTKKEDSLTTCHRKQRDSEIMQQKLKAATEKKSMQTKEKW
ncbi:unnamed protein product [Nyctereutes procyonoides]|uniref:(raccoon dog) hypothetical protein n=1 Tax=Nyctereutes procyonoides TaxID=34880 RepID=A0A811Z675_NYCPR|nr:unnamed protein product [Nyctereutes procyonoides]